MKGKVFLDTNVLVYLFAENDQRADTAERLLARGAVIGVQTFNEFVSVAVRKLAMSWVEVKAALSGIRRLCPDPVAISVETHERALDISERYGYPIYDALVISAALQSGCEILYSEDLQDGQVIASLTIRNPFRATTN